MTFARRRWRLSAGGAVTAAPAVVTLVGLSWHHGRDGRAGAVPSELDRDSPPRDHRADDVPRDGRDHEQPTTCGGGEPRPARPLPPPARRPSRRSRPGCRSTTPRSSSGAAARTTSHPQRTTILRAGPGWPVCTAHRATGLLQARRSNGHRWRCSMQPAKGSDRIGSLVIDPGGPGRPDSPDAPTSPILKSIPRLNESFDIVGIDPRGVGASIPGNLLRVRRAKGRRPSSQLAGLHAHRHPGRGRRCERSNQGVRTGLSGQQRRQRRQSGKEFLPTVGTVTVAKDLDVLRAVLGDTNADLPRLFLRHEHRHPVCRTVPGKCAGVDPRRRYRPRREQ